MTARIHRSFDFHAGVYIDGEFYMNAYDVDMTFSVETDSIYEQNIALERIKYFLHDCLEHSIFIDENEHDMIEKYNDANLRVCSLPEEPYDQIIGIMLLIKFGAIAEGRLVPSDISITSRMSDGVSCLHDAEEDTGPFNGKGWWYESSTVFNNYKPKNKKVLKLAKTKTDWAELELGWEESEDETTESAEIVFHSFDKPVK